MVLIFDELEFHIIENTGRRRGYRGGPGFYWQEPRMPPVGSFRTAADAIRDVAEWVESGRLAAALDAKAAERARRLSDRGL